MRKEVVVRGWEGFRINVFAKIKQNKTKKNLNWGKNIRTRVNRSGFENRFGFYNIKRKRK